MPCDVLYTAVSRATDINNVFIAKGHKYVTLSYLIMYYTFNI